jgi:hypothetical protein
VDLYGIIQTPTGLKRVPPCNTVTWKFYLHNQDFQRPTIPANTFTITITKTYPNGTEVTLFTGGNPELPNCTDVLIYQGSEHIERGLYKIKATITPDPVTGFEDQDGYTIYIWGTLFEDINMDFYVNAKDAVALGRAFGSKPGEYTWDPACDINRDGFVNAKDAVLLGAKFGWGGGPPI